MLGQALGDALGFVVEAQPADAAQAYVNDWLRSGRAGQRSHPDFPFGQYTDDTQMARELLCSVRDQGGWDPGCFAGRLARLFEEGRDVGAGEGSRAAARRLCQGVHWSESGAPAPYAGNGSAIRAGPLGLLFTRSADASSAAQEQSRITHRDSRCAAGAVAIALAVAMAGRPGRLVAGEFLEELSGAVRPVEATFAQAIRTSADWLGLEPQAAARELHRSGLDFSYPEWQGISAFVIPSVLWSLYSFLRSPDDYWETVCTAIQVGGDTDSLAAMAGAVSGAHLGVEALPETLLSRINDRGEWDAAALAQLARECATLVTGDEPRASEY